MAIKDFFAEYCDRCVHSHLDLNRGVVCGLTDKRPESGRACGDLVIDVEREEDVLLRKRLNRRVDQFRALDDEHAELNPYPDPQGRRPRGRLRVIIYLLTARSSLRKDRPCASSYPSWPSLSCSPRYLHSAWPRMRDHRTRAMPD